MKNQASFSSKDKSKKIKCCLLQFLFGALRVNLHCQSVNIGFILLLFVYGDLTDLTCININVNDTCIKQQDNHFVMSYVSMETANFVRLR